VAYPGETSSMQAHNDVTVQVNIIRAPRDNGSNLRGSGSIIPAQVCAGIHSDVNHNTELFTWRLLPEDLVGLLVHVHIGVAFQEHVVEVRHGGRVKVGVVVHPCSESQVSVQDVELGIAWLVARRWEEGTHLVVKGTMELEGIRPRASYDSIIHLCSHRCEGKGKVELVDVFPEALGQCRAALEDGGEGGWWMSKRR